jgi:putative endonuclease
LNCKVFLKMPIAYVYILTNINHTILYIGSTVDFTTRIWEHKTKRNPKSFTAKYNLNKLVYFEEFIEVEDARAREIFLKKKTFSFKCDLITKINPSWIELNTEENRSAQLY